MQRLMDRLIDCLPRGAAARDWVVQMALLTVAKESFQVGQAGEHAAFDANRNSHRTCVIYRRSARPHCSHAGHCLDLVASTSRVVSLDVDMS